MSTRLPEGPGRRALVKGGLAAAIAAALGSCGLGQMPALADTEAKFTIYPHGILKSLWPVLSQAQREAGYRLSNAEVLEAIKKHFWQNGVAALPAGFKSDQYLVTLHGWAEERRADGAKELYLGWTAVQLWTGLAEFENERHLLNIENRST